MIRRGLALTVTIDPAVVSGVSGSFIPVRRRALIARRPASGRKERKMSVLETGSKGGGGWAYAHRRVERCCKSFF